MTLGLELRWIMDNLEKELRVFAQSYREGYLTARQFRAAIVPALVNDAAFWYDRTKADYLASAFLGDATPPSAPFPANDNLSDDLGEDNVTVP